MIHHFGLSGDLNLDERNLPNYSYIANKQEWRKLEQNHFRFWWPEPEVETEMKNFELFTQLR